MKSAIRDAAHATPLLMRMMKRNAWPPHVIETIHWDAHRLSTSSAHRLQKTHFVKLCHGYLPAGKIAHRNNSSNPDSCPLCKTTGEDHQHILQCAHPSRAVWRKKLSVTLSKMCVTLQTDPILKSVLLNGISCWLQHTPFDTDGIPSNYDSLIMEQQEIGWYNIFLAQFTKQWAVCQSNYLKTQNNTAKGLSGDKWVSTICTVITSAWLELWDSRNKDRHGADSSLKSIALSAQAVREIRILYTYQDKVLQKDKHLFTTDLSTQISGPTNHIRQWINTYQKVILKSAKAAQTIAVLNVRTITTYFPIRGHI
jgi:hypothetical protein